MKPLDVKSKTYINSSKLFDLPNGKDTVMCLIVG